jgi:hypothetical protein
VVVGSHQADAVDHLRHAVRDERDIGRAGGPWIGWSDGPKTKVTARLVVHRQQSPVAV